MQVIIFGGSGHLAMSKLVPALYNLNCNVHIILYGRSDLKTTYKNKLLQFYSYYTATFLNNITYIQGEYDNLINLKSLSTDNTILYIALPPQIYPVILTSIETIKYSKIGLEKPYGINLNHYKTLKITDKIILIDHYLAKNISLAYPLLKQKNLKLYNFLNKNNITSIKCYFCETSIIKNNNSFKSIGIIKDVMENHLIQMLAIILSNPEETNLSIGRRHLINNMEIDSTTLNLKQYKNFDIHHNFKETYASFQLKIKNDLWSNIPCSFIAGKGLKTKQNRIIFNININKAFEIIRNTKFQIENIKSISLIFSFDESSIYYEIQTDVITNIYIYSKDEILKIIDTHFYSKSDYEYIFYCMLHNKFINMPTKAEAFDIWKLFDNIIDKCSMYEYYEICSDPF